MKKALELIVIFGLSFIQISCAQKQQEAGNKSSDLTIYTFSEDRMSKISDLCSKTAIMLEENNPQSKNLNKQLSMTADSMEMVIRHCDNIDFNKWIRGFARHYFQAILLADGVEKDVKGKFILMPYEWTITRTDTSEFAYISMFRSSGEMYQRFAEIYLNCNSMYRKCLFMIADYADLNIENVTINFIGIDNDVKSLRPADAEFTDYADYDDGILRIVFPIDTFLSLFKDSQAIELTYDTGKEKVLMTNMVFEDEKNLVMDVFKEKH